MYASPTFFRQSRVESACMVAIVRCSISPSSQVAFLTAFLQSWDCLSADLVSFPSHSRNVRHRPGNCCLPLPPQTITPLADTLPHNPAYARAQNASNGNRGAPLNPYLPGDTYRFPSEPLLLRKCPIAFPCQNIYNNSGQQKRQAGRVLVTPVRPYAGEYPSPTQQI